MFFRDPYLTPTLHLYQVEVVRDKRLASQWKNETSRLSQKNNLTQEFSREIVYCLWYILSVGTNSELMKKTEFGASSSY
jgi:hypothetical protein